MTSTRRTVRLGGLSFLLRPRLVVVTASGVAALLLVVALNLGIGSVHIGLSDVVSALFGAGDPLHHNIIWELRMPRTLVGILVGGALGVAGAIFQSIARNPLASPDVLGVTWGAAAAAVGVIVLEGTRGQITGGASTIGVPLAGLLGGLLAGVLLYVLSWRRGIDGYRMVLIGIGIAAIGYNLVYWLLSVGDVDDAARAVTWLVGNLADVGWDGVAPVSIALAVLVPVAVIAGRTLGGLQYGDDTARGLGIRVDRARGALLLLAVALAAVATSATGPIAFVALATPQITLRLAGTAQPPLVGSMVFGALLTVSADLVVRTVPLLSGLPVGVLTAVLGAPYLVFLFIRRRREERV
ncbi:iron complex transport system permease protein [Herbihabitans rhizosphaerae]|uniref:Iron complex transport system permease protein n=1 Tax=Herbihabitans rhizosphaerae TaxID=1872711 RepID=A0A4Q7KVY7_9PSEU|nr:iron chelate uptake ABC transporter family permease subunit [Herbihabitans rhizosphaerae]RZS41199.1 iron complex transport system permease protein [Herbihabitans rhizosphaerae]